MLSTNMCRYSEIKDYTFGQEPCGGPVTGDPSLWDDCLYFSLNQLKLPFMLVCCTKFFFEPNLPFNDQIKLRNLHQGHFHFPGHFSQVVWRDSTQLGVGLAQKDGKVYHHHRHNYFHRCYHDHRNLLVIYLVQRRKGIFASRLVVLELRFVLFWLILTKSDNLVSSWNPIGWDRACSTPPNTNTITVCTDSK